MHVQIGADDITFWSNVVVLVADLISEWINELKQLRSYK